VLNFQLAHFVTSAPTLAECPPDTGAEVAFAGRSNAGKSSCINALTQHSKLARTSKTPGRTQLLNFFALDDERRLVDLPGYGFAKVPLEVKRAWDRHLAEYLRKRRSLKGLVLLMDIRHPLQPFDLNMLDWAKGAGLNIHVVLTKSDKLNRSPAQAALLAVQKKLADLNIAVSAQLFSAEDKTGLDTLREQVSAWME